jgi:hypothetical protein
MDQVLLMWSPTKICRLGKNIPRENIVWCKSVVYWKVYWEGYNEGTYDGGWGHESDKELLSPNSDTDSAAPSNLHESESARDESDQLDVCNIFYRFFGQKILH